MPFSNRNEDKDMLYKTHIIKKSQLLLREAADHLFVLSIISKY